MKALRRGLSTELLHTRYTRHASTRYGTSPIWILEDHTDKLACSRIYAKHHKNSDY